MKKVISILLSVLMLCSVTAGLNLTVYAAETGDWSDTIKYSYDEDTCELTLSGQGVLTYSDSFSEKFSEKDVRSVAIQEGITSISNGVFACEDNSFYGDLQSVTLPEGLLSIGNFAFWHCWSLSSIVIPNSVTTIGDYAFELCDNLREITLSDGLVTIGEGAFGGCSLTKVVIPNSIKNIGDSAFSGDVLSVVITQDNVKIGDDVFGPYTIIFCPSTTKIKNQGIVRYTDKTPVQITKAVQEADGWYDEDTNLYYILPNETGDYYANVEYIFDENLNAVPCEYISVGGVDEGGRCYDGSGYRFQLEAGKRYYLAYKDSIIIKDFCYDGSSDKKYITNDVAGLKCAKATFWDDSTKTYEFYYNTSGVWDDEGPAFISTDLNQPIYGYFCGQSIEFSLNSPASVKSYEILNSSALNEKFEKQIRSYETIKNNAAVYRLHLSDGTTYDVKNYTMKPGAGEKIGDVFWCQYLLYTADGRIFSVNYQYNVNKPTAMSVWLDGFSDNPIKVTVAHNTHTYKQMVTKATTAKDGQTYKKCTVCGAVTGKTVIAKASNIKLNKTAYTYNGKVQKPSVAVKDSKGKTLKNGTDYTVSYPKGMKNVGKYTVKVTLKGNYSGSKSMTYNINPKGTSVSKVTAAKKGFKVTWKKQATQTTGYEVQYSTASNFKKGNKTVTVSKNKTTSKSVSKLSAKKKYYVRVRTYKTVKIGGKNVKLYSGWSKAKSVTTKK